MASSSFPCQWALNGPCGMNFFHLSKSVRVHLYQTDLTASSLTAHAPESGRAPCVRTVFTLFLLSYSTHGFHLFQLLSAVQQNNKLMKSFSFCQEVASCCGSAQKAPETHSWLLSTFSVFGVKTLWHIKIKYTQWVLFNLFIRSDN